MADSVPRFRSVETRGFKRPAFAKDLDALADDIIDAIADVPNEHAPAYALGHRTAILRAGKPHPAIAGVSTDVDFVDLQTNYDLAADGASLWGDAKDDALYQVAVPAGAVTIDVAETIDLAIAHHIGFNNNYDDSTDDDSRRDVYLLNEPPRVFVIEGSSTADSGAPLYGGRQARLKADPAAEGSPWEVHPEAVDYVALYNLRDLTGTPGDPLPAGTAVLASRRSFPKQGDRPAGVCWVFVYGGGAESTGEHQYMVRAMTSDNVAGWDVVRAHPVL